MDQEIQQMANKYPRYVAPAPPAKKETVALGKWTIALLAAVLFVVLSSNWMYKALNGLTKNYVVLSSDEGCPNIKGLLIVAIVFLLILRLILW